MREPPARVIGRYSILATLGSGGMADVYLARAQGRAGFTKLLVIKALRPSFQDDEGYRAMFLDEARLAARMNHPNIAQTFEVDESDGTQFLTMEYLEGQTYHAVVRKLKDAFPLEHGLRALSQMLAGLHYAHELRDYEGEPLDVVHRDVSPPNLFLTYDGQVKVMDFGIAKSTESSVLTATGIIKGKIAYMAPEQALGQPIDRRVDVFAAGVMLWELLTRRRINADDSSEVVTLQKRISTPLPSVLEVNGSAPRKLAEICSKAVAFKREDRFATAALFHDALEHYLDDEGLAAKPRELGALVADAFAETRERLRVVIDYQLAALGTAPTAEVTGSAPELAADEPLTVSQSGATALLHEPEERATTTRRPRWALPALSALALAGAALGFRQWHARPPIVGTAESSRLYAVAPSVSAQPGETARSGASSGASDVLGGDAGRAGRAGDPGPSADGPAAVAASSRDSPPAQPPASPPAARRPLSHPLSHPSARPQASAEPGHFTIDETDPYSGSKPAP